MYSVEAEYIESVVAKYGPGKWLVTGLQIRITNPFWYIATKMGAIVAGQV